MKKRQILPIFASIFTLSCTPYCIKAAEKNTNEAIAHVDYLAGRLKEYKAQKGHFLKGIRQLINNLVQRDRSTDEAGMFWQDLPQEWKEKIQGTEIKTSAIKFTMHYEEMNGGKTFAINIHTNPFAGCYVSCWYNSRNSEWECYDK